MRRSWIGDARAGGWRRGSEAARGLAVSSGEEAEHGNGLENDRRSRFDCARQFSFFS
jgi:hypothetical protein